MLKAHTYPDYEQFRKSGSKFPFSGLSRFKGQSVFVKLNLVVPPTPNETQSVVHPIVIEAVAAALQYYGAKSVVMGDGGFIGKWDVYQELMDFPGIEKRTGCKIINIRTGKDAKDFPLLRIDDYISLYGIQISQYALDCDAIISVAKLKSHSMCRFTGCIKNLMGMMKFKGNMHPGSSEPILHKRLCDLYSALRNRVKYCVIDGIVGSGYSECSGIYTPANIIIAADNMWEADVYGSRSIGMAAESIPYLKYIADKFGYDFDQPHLFPKQIVMFEESPLYQNSPKYGE
jgi:uncharacterized protein (DUF362 family)